MIESTPWPQIVEAIVLIQRCLPFVLSFNFDKTIELDSSNELSLSDVYMTRGANFMGLGDNQAAIQDLDKAIELNEDNAYAYNARAMILLELGQSELSKKDSARACELDRLLC